MSSDFLPLRRRDTLAFALGWAGGIARAWAAPGTVLIVLSDNGGVFQQAADELQTALQSIKTDWTVRRAYVTELDAVPTPQLALPLGTAAYRAVTEKTRRTTSWAEVPVIGSLLPRASHVAVHQALGPRALNSAVVLDQPVIRSLRLAQQAMPTVNRIGVLYGPQSQALRGTLGAAARSLGITLVESQVAGEAAPDDLFAPLSAALEGADLLLALPDSVVYNATSLQNLLIASYRRRVPLLGYTAAQVRAGATLGLYSTSAQSAQQVATLALAQLSSPTGSATRLAGPASGALEPTLFEVGVNTQVARSLGLGIASPATLTEALQRLEARR